MPDSGFTAENAFSAGQRGPDFAAPQSVVEAPPQPITDQAIENAAPPPGPGRTGPPRLACPIIAVVAAMLIIGAGVAAVIIASIGANGPMPEETARAFVAAAYRSDCDAVRATITDEFWNGAQLSCMDVSFHGSDFADTTVEDWSFADTKITKDIATITLDPPGDLPPTELRMRLVDGTWKITSWQF